MVRGFQNFSGFWRVKPSDFTPQAQGDLILVQKCPMFRANSGDKVHAFLTWGSISKLRVPFLRKLHAETLNVLRERFGFPRPSGNVYESGLQPSDIRSEDFYDHS
jgi:hypothetical protein